MAERQGAVNPPALNRRAYEKPKTNRPESPSRASRPSACARERRSINRRPVAASEQIPGGGSPLPTALTQAARVGAMALASGDMGQVGWVGGDQPMAAATCTLARPGQPAPWKGEEPVTSKEEVIRVDGANRALGIKACCDRHRAQVHRQRQWQGTLG